MKSLVQYIKESYDSLYNYTVQIKTSDPEKAAPSIDATVQKTLKQVKADFSAKAAPRKDVVSVQCFSSVPSEIYNFVRTLKKNLPDVYAQSIPDDFEVSRFDD